MFDTFSSAIEWLYQQFPAFHNVGQKAYKPGLETITSLCEALGRPQDRFKAIHIAGTNGKGSTAHSLAAVLQASGLKTGLYTSPHLVDFRERIRVDGQMISREEVLEFLNRVLAYFQLSTFNFQLSAPSFFELATAMAFDHFARHGVDIAVIETGLGGRLDSTNILRPVISVITNISLDHTDLLGDTLAKIASEKAGIIKEGIPVVVGEAEDHEVREVFLIRAAETGSAITFARDRAPYSGFENRNEGILYHDTPYGDILCDLAGDCQPRNMATVITTLGVLGVTDADAVRRGLGQVCSATGLMGRWQTLAGVPRHIIVDTGHNEGCWQYLAPRLSRIRPLTAVLGFCADKDVAKIIEMLPAGARYIFTAADTRRAMAPDQLLALARRLRPELRACSSAPDVRAAYAHALEVTPPGGTVFVGGSTFVVADLLTAMLP